MGRPTEIHLFDFDGRSVLERQQLEVENAKLRAEVERLHRVIAMMKRQAGEAVPVRLNA
ncbi:hypothetical protein [Inquilinus sp. OTU3971]|uniref:hypothetical protein n=1 Tax=Inquilinus sp. OTU3971 TaxID=3043855 RepID=UPI00313B2E80